MIEKDGGDLALESRRKFRLEPAHGAGRSLDVALVDEDASLKSASRIRVVSFVRRSRVHNHHCARIYAVDHELGTRDIDDVDFGIAHPATEQRIEPLNHAPDDLCERIW